MFLSQSFIRTLAALSISFSLFGVDLSGSDVAAEEVKIGAWNIEWLGHPDMRGSPSKNRAQKPSDLAERIHESGVTVLALEEIGVESPETRRSDELDATFKVMKEKYDQDWKYILFAKTDYTGQEVEDFTLRGQHIGVAWQTSKATQVGEPFSIDVGTNATFGYKFWERRANAIKLSFGEGKTDIVVIPIHLKSNRNDNKEDKNFTRKQRAEEVRAFVAQLSNLKNQFKDEDIVLMGDFNFLADDDEGPKILKDNGFVDLNESDEGTTANWGKGYTSAPFDRIFVVKSQPEFEGAKQTIFRAGTSDDEIKNYRKTFSDHYMVYTEIEVGKDDD